MQQGNGKYFHLLHSGTHLFCHYGFREPDSDIAFALSASLSQLIDAYACDDRAEIALWILYDLCFLVTAGCIPTEERFLHTIFCVHHTSEHIVGNGEEQGPIGLNDLFLFHSINCLYHVEATKHPELLQ